MQFWQSAHFRLGMDVFLQASNAPMRLIRAGEVLSFASDILEIAISYLLTQAVAVSAGILNLSLLYVIFCIFMQL